MPSVLGKGKVLDGRGEVVSYKHAPGIYVYREWVKQRRAYRSKQLTGARNLDDAKAQALKVAFKFAGKSDPANKKEQKALDKKLRTKDMKTAVEEYWNTKRKELKLVLFKRIHTKGKLVH